MNIDSSFSATYEEARAKFFEICSERDLEYRSQLHPRTSLNGDVLATDVTRIGSADATRVFFTMSATHGVEGFCGSGVQVHALRSGFYNDLPANVCVVLIHAINPFGFSWLRRVTHENIDLNRNHVAHDEPWPQNEGYEELKSAICPSEWTEASEARNRRTFAEYAEKHGPMAYQRAVSGGQYSHPSGLFFGGNKISWSAETLGEFIRMYSQGAEHVGFLDYHTGLGPHGYGELISDHQLDDPGHARLCAWFGDEIASTEDGSSVSAQLTGTNGNCVAANAAPADTTMVTLEFGTSPMTEVLNALRADCWLHNYGDLSSPLGKSIKAEIRRCFYPDTTEWKQMIWDRSSAVEQTMIENLARL